MAFPLACKEGEEEEATEVGAGGPFAILGPAVPFFSDGAEEAPAGEPTKLAIEANTPAEYGAARLTLEPSFERRSWEASSGEGGCTLASCACEAAAEAARTSASATAPARVGGVEHPSFMSF